MGEYVKNRELYEALVEYQKSCRKAKKLNLDKPEVPSYISKAIIMISERYSTKYKFSRYLFRDEMIGDAIQSCVAYGIDKYNVKYTNPLAYFTQIVHNAFLNRIKLEKKALFTKFKLTRDYDLQMQLENNEYNPYTNQETEEMDIYISDYEERRKEKLKETARKKRLRAKNKTASKKKSK